MDNDYTVKHYNATLDRWIVESEAGIIWTTNAETAAKLAAGYEGWGFAAEAVKVSELGETERVNEFNDNLALVKS